MLVRGRAEGAEKNLHPPPGSYQFELGGGSDPPESYQFELGGGSDPPRSNLLVLGGGRGVFLFGAPPLRAKCIRPVRWRSSRSTRVGS